MRFMHWSYDDYMTLPERYRVVLVEEIVKHLQEQKRQADLARAKRGG